MNSILLASLLAAAAGDDVFSRFDSWASTWRAAKTDYARSQLVDEGVALAKGRRVALLELFKNDPSAALKKQASRDALPETVTNEMELPLAGVARWEVLGVLMPNHEGGVQYWLVLGAQRYRVTAYGSLVGIPTLDRLSIQGLSLGGWAAISDQHVPRIGGSQSAWTTGTKRLRFIRVDFSDAQGDPLSQSSAQTLANQLNSYLTAASFGKTQLNPITVTTTLRMPRTKAQYDSANDTDGLLRDARTAASGAGFAQGDLDVLAFTKINGWSWSGLGFIGQSGAWLNGSFTLGTVAHEVGHNYGLYHANFWEAGGETIIGSGSSLEYGNPFDIMGDGDGHYNAWYKAYLAWITAAEVGVAATSNTYRVYDLEAVIGGGTHAVRVPIGSTRDYWVEFRPAGGGTLARGASINWGYNRNDSSDLLDMTPWTRTADDSALVIGRTFSDFTAGIHITPTGLGGTSPASLDVTVNRGLFATNHAPTVTLTCTANGTSYDCTTTAADQDGDPLAYYWDFGDNVASTNQATQSRTISGSRDVLARVTVSDMKGGTATASQATRFGNPSTYRITGTVAESGVGVEGVRIYSGTKMTWTNSDGTYTLVGLSSGSYAVSAIKPGWAFIAAFTNPVNVGTANVPNINFTTSRSTYSITGRVTSLGVGFNGATVSAGRYSTVTNSNGDYTLTGVPAGAYVLSATGPAGENFVPQGFTSPVQITTSSLTNRNFIELVYTVGGKVTGLPGPHLVTDGVRNANSALNGGMWTWSLPKVPPGTWNLVATATGQTIVPTNFVNPITVTAAGVLKDGTGATKATFDFDSTAGAVFLVSGYVDEAGSPSLNSVIDAGVAVATTDSRGIYVIPNLPAGLYTLSPGKPGFVFGPATQDVTLPNPDGGLDWYGADFVLLMGNVPPSFAVQPHANPSPVPGTTCNLFTLGHDPIEAESTLKYTWNQVFGTAATTFTNNGNNAAKGTTVTFTKPGAYAFDVTVADPGGLSSTSSVTVLVLQTTTAVTVTPATSTVNLGDFKQLVAAVKDQFGGDVDFGGEAAWSVSPASCGTITQTGKLTTAGTGACTVTAEYDGKMGTATVNVVVGAAPRVTAGPTANPNPVTMGTTTALSVTADDDNGEAALVYAWTMVNGPAAVAFSVNGSNAAKNTVATFSQAGSYDLAVEVKDANDISTSGFLNVMVMAGGLARITVSGPKTLGTNETGTYSAAGFDLAGGSVATGACTWSSTAGDISASGVLTAKQTGAVTATCGAVSGSIDVEVKMGPVTMGGCHCGSAEGMLAFAAVLLLRRRRR